MPESGEKVRAGRGLGALYAKELGDQLLSKRFVIILALVYFTSLLSLYGVLINLSDSIASDSNFIFLKLYTASGSSIPSFKTFIAILGPFVGLSLGFDAINSERAGGTLNRLVAQPIYRDSIIIGKFLASLTVIAIMVFFMGIFIGCMGVLASGLIPETEEVLRIFTFLFYTVMYIAFWLALSIFFSVVCKHSATSALSVIAIWLGLTLFMSTVAEIVAGVVYPINTQYQQMYNTLANYTLELNLNRISPYYLYSEAASAIMSPSVRTVNAVTYSSLEGAISSYLSFGQSLLLIWPHLVALIALVIAAFAGSYVGFMRQEIRSN